MGYTNITTTTLKFKRATVADGLNPDTTSPVFDPSAFSTAEVSKSWRLIQGKPRVWYERIACVQFDEDEIAALARKAVWFERGSDYFRFYTSEGFSNQTSTTPIVSAQALQKAVDFSALTYNSLPARLTLYPFSGSALTQATETVTYQLIWDDTQGYKTPEALKQALLYGMAFACANDDETYPNGDLTQYYVKGSVSVGSMLLCIHTADVQLEAENLTPGYNEYVAPNEAATLTWSVKEPAAYFTTKPTQARFEVQYNVLANGVQSEWKTLTGTTAQEATIPAIDLIDAEAFHWRVRIQSDDGVWGEWSDWRRCTCVNQTGKAVALSPDGASVSAGETVAFLWEHSSAAGRAQAGAQIQMRAAGAEEWTDIYTGTTTARRADVPLPESVAQTAGQAAWRVRTRDDLGGWSEWSDALYVYVVSASQAPTVAVYSGDTMRPRVEWQSENQTGYRVKIRDAAGATVYDSGVLAGSGQSHEVTAYLNDGQYTAAVTVWNQYAMESAEGTQSFTISAGAAKPEAAGLTLKTAAQGAVTFTVSPAPEGEWILLRDGAAVPFVRAEATVTDYDAAVGAHEYILRVQTDAAYTDSDSVTATTEIDGGALALADDPQQMIFLRLGRDGAPSHADDMAIEATQRGFAGRTLPVVEFSGRRDHIHRHTFALPERSEMQKLIDMLLEQKPMLYRDQYGRRYDCVCTSLPVTYDAFSESFTLELTEIDNGLSGEAEADNATPDEINARVELADVNGLIIAGKTAALRYAARNGAARYVYAVSFKEGTDSDELTSAAVIAVPKNINAKMTLKNGDGAAVRATTDADGTHIFSGVDFSTGPKTLTVTCGKLTRDYQVSASIEGQTVTVYFALRTYLVNSWLDGYTTYYDYVSNGYGSSDDLTDDEWDDASSASSGIAAWNLPNAPESIDSTTNRPIFAQNSYVAIEMDADAKVMDVLTTFISQYSALSQTGAGSNYISEIAYGSNALGEFTCGYASGWMYTARQSRTAAARALPNVGASVDAIADGMYIDFIYSIADGHDLGAGE